MNLASVILILQMAVSLLTNPNLASNSAARDQAFSFANEAIALANEALSQPGTTTLQDQVTTSTPPEIPEIATSSQSVATGAAVAPAVNVPSSAPVPVTPKTIQVLFSANSDGALVTINNNAGVAVRIKNLDVEGGTLEGMTIGSVYGEGLVYSPSFTDGAGNSFNRFECKGLGSLGMAIEYGGNIDPCKRKDGNGAINELQAGETMVLRYGGTPAGVTYQAGSIVEAGSGNDVTF